LELEGMRVSRQIGFVSGRRLWRIAVVTATGMLGVTSQSEAAIYYWQDSASAAQPAPKAPAGHAKARRQGDKKSNVVVNESAKPQGPLIISVSIAQQKLRIYDANGLFAETPVSTGMPGHSTPMGVFSVIQKQKFHQSNIYSGAPMPYMQRITWSGIALHAGVLPGHPASHGCIRMPMAFAVKMYNWTRMGARVVVTPGDVTPAAFSHPLLATVKVLPQPVAAEETKADLAAVQKPEKPADIEAKIAQPAVADTKIELRSTVGHTNDIKPATDESRSPTLPQIQTADASGTLPAAPPSKVMSDAAPAGKHVPPTESAVSDKQDVSRAAEADASKTEPNAAKPDETKPDEMASSNDKPTKDESAETQAANTADSEPKPAATESDQASKPGTTASEAVKPNDTTIEAAAPASPIEATKAKARVQGEKPADTAQAAPASMPAPANTPLKDDLKSDFAKTAASKLDSAAALKRSIQIAVFVSRKDSKLYVRQNFSPLFDVPVTIAADERPLGTHIFTARVDSSDANVLRWSVVSLPFSAKAVSRRAEEERSPRGRKLASTAPIEAKPLPMPDSPAEALDRLSLPADVMARIYEVVSTGGSIIVSDQGIAAGETGEGTDFIVSLR
jgi:lipoprotein-anchoring transpeptidase ErfK/SrfK